MIETRNAPPIAREAFALLLLLVPSGCAVPTVSEQAALASQATAAPAPQPASNCKDEAQDLASALKQPGLPIVAPSRDERGRVAWSRIEWWSCGKTFPLHSASTPTVPPGEDPFADKVGADVYGALVSSDRKWLFVLQMGPSHYAGAISPMMLGRVELTAVDLRTSQPHRLATNRLYEPAQSALIAFEGSTLAIQWRDVGNGSQDGRSFESCDLASSRCEKVPAAPAALAEARDVLEVTAMATYAGRAQQGTNLGKNDVLARTRRASPSGAHVAFVTERSPDEDKEYLPARRTLWVFDRKTGSSRVVAAGRTMFEPVWVSDDELVYRPEAEPTPELSAKLDAVVARAAGQPEQPTTPEAKVRERSFFVELAAREAMSEGLPFERALRYPLRKLDVRTGVDDEVHAGPAAPFGSPTRPDLHHKGRTHEVPD